jgi:hypothetical protein
MRWMPGIQARGEGEGASRSPSRCLVEVLGYHLKWAPATWNRAIMVLAIATRRIFMLVLLVRSGLVFRFNRSSELPLEVGAGHLEQGDHGAGHRNETHLHEMPPFQDELGQGHDVPRARRGDPAAFQDRDLVGGPPLRSCPGGDGVSPICGMPSM